MFQLNKDTNNIYKPDTVTRKEQKPRISIGQSRLHCKSKPTNPKRKIHLWHKQITNGEN